MRTRKLLNLALLIALLASLLMVGLPASAENRQSPPAASSASVRAAPASPTDETKVPHYFGPNPNWANSPFTLPDVTLTINGDGSGAKAVASVGGTGALTGVTVTDPGVRYTAATVDVTGAGTGAALTAHVTKSGIVSSISVDPASQGSGYTQPSVSISGGGGTGTLVSVGNNLIARQFATDFATAPGALGPVFVVIPTTMPAAGMVQGIQYFNQATTGGSPTPSAGNLFHAYVLRATGTPSQYTVVWDSGEQTVPAAVDPVGDIVTIPVPNISVTTGDTIAFYGEGIPVDDLGTGADILSYPAPTAPVLSGIITLGGADFPIYSQTRTYSFGASVVDTSAVVPLVNATATAYGGVDAVTVDPLNPGTGYTNPTVDFDLPDDPAGVQAKAHAVWDAAGVITGVVVDDPGSGYAAAPKVTIRDGTIFDPINNGGSGAKATATLKILSVTVDTYGSGYTSAPKVDIIDPTGTGAVAAATISAGGVTSITIDSNGNGSGYITPGGIKKFTDPLPEVCLPPNCPSYETNPTAKYIPLGVPENKAYNNVAADEYVIGLVQYRTNFSSSLKDPATKLPVGTLVRGYVQLETAANAAVSQHFPLVNEMLNGTSAPISNPRYDPACDPTLGWCQPQFYLGVTPPQWLGPTIAATKNKPVRIVFYNLLPKGSEGGNLFLPVDTTLMGSGMGPMAMAASTNNSSVMDDVRNPMCTDDPQAVDSTANPPMDLCFQNNRATLHLHGGTTPWISDGTAHQWITPAGEKTSWPEGVSVSNVPDMQGAGCDSKTDGCMTFYYTNQQSARLLFYHDHAWGITRLNVYAGEAAGYLIGDDTEAKLVNANVIPGVADTIPLIVQDRTFVPQDKQLYNYTDPNTGTVSYGQDPTWDKARWGGYGNFWYHHVYMPAQNPGDPSGMSAYGRWMYGPWFWPPAKNAVYPPIANPYYNMDPATNFTTALAKPCNLDDPTTWQYKTDPFCEPQLIPGTPNISVGMEQFNDTPIVNGTAYPTKEVQPKSYRLRILNAANDRFFNFQWYVADPTTGTNSEVALKAAELQAAQTDPNVFPTPDTAISPAGPSWIQIGSEGGFLPAPTVVPNQPITWITDPTRFDVGNVDKHSLLLAPAERADVIVDFSQFAGKTLILYNDAPAAFPARVASYDYYTGAPDMSPVGAPAILPGYGPNTRTIMQVKVAAATPAPAFNLTALQNAFKHHADGSGVFESGQHPIIVGQAAYNSAYGTSFAASGDCTSPTSTIKCDGLARINQQGGDPFTFDTLKGATTGSWSKLSIKLEPKALHDEMNSASFDEFGRMTANLGLEAVPANPAAQNIILYPFVNPATELIDATNLPKLDQQGLENGLKMTPIATADGTQIWKITHNGVDTHPIHFHLYDVQILNRVTWDNIIIPTEPSELGWKDTIRVSPLEDTIVALRPVIPWVPWELPNSIRPLNPMMPIGSTAMFNNIDAAGNPTNAITNQYVNFGWEYVYHCHILSHEEMDMMRPVSVAMPPTKPDKLAYTISGSGNNTFLTLSWNDNSINETAFTVQRDDGSGWVDLGTVLSPLDQQNTTTAATMLPRTYDDRTYRRNMIVNYRVVAKNTIGYGGQFMSLTAQSVSDPMPAGEKPAAPSNLTATAQAGPQVSLTWRDNATNESGFVIERCTGQSCTDFAQLATAPARNNTGNVTYVDKTVAPDTWYTYRVAAVNVIGTSAYAGPISVNVPANSGGAPLPPSNLVATLQLGPQVSLTWTDNATNEASFTVQRCSGQNCANFVQIATAPAHTNTGSVTYVDTTVVAGNAYTYQVAAVNGSGPSSFSNEASVTLGAAPAAPTNLVATAARQGNNNRVTLNWTPPAGTVTGYTIQRATNSTFTTGVTNINVAGGGTNSYVDTVPRGTPGVTTYWYQIQALNGVVPSVWSAPLSIVTR